jgi:deoxycytidine triphosphate deaminase
VILSDNEIAHAIYTREIVISHSPEESRIQPCSIDLHLGTRFGKLRPTQIDRYGPEPKGPEVDWVDLTDPEDFITLYPGGFLDAGTWETVEILAPNLVGSCAARAPWPGTAYRSKQRAGRSGLAGRADPGVEEHGAGSFGLAAPPADLPDLLRSSGRTS